MKEQQCNLVVYSALVAALLYLGHASAAFDTPSPLALGEHDAPLGDVTLHYAVAGKGPPLIVPSPGWGPTSLYLQRSLAPLEATYTMVYVDSRGSGGSSRPVDASRITFADDADDMEHLRGQLRLATIDLLGIPLWARRRSTMPSVTQQRWDDLFWSTRLP